jgi:hypothetical protein
MGLIDKLHDFQLRAFDNLSVPVMKTPVIDGTPGSATYSYKATFKTINGESLPTAEISVTNGYTTLDGFHRVKVWVEPPLAGARSVRFFKKDGSVFKLLSEVAVLSSNTDAVAVWDQGQALTNVQPPTTDTSGRPGYFLLLPNTAKNLQRSEISDLQAMLSKQIANIADSIHAAGDVITGCGLTSLGDNEWRGATGRLYAGGGFFVPVPTGDVTIVGTGRETVGVRITPVTVTDTDDPVLRNPDENIALQYAHPGAYRLGVEVTWVVDDPAMVPIQEFLNGQPITRMIPVEQTGIQRMIAGMLKDLAGTFGVINFQCSKLAHPTDDTKFRLRVATGGKAYPDGWRTQLAAPQIIDVPKAREYASVNASTTDPFSNLGGSVTGTVAQNFDVNGKSVKFRVDSTGNSHTVTFGANGQSASQVCTSISNAVNAYPSSESPALVTCTAVSGHVKITARDGHDLIIEAVSNDAYTLLGISTGTYSATGTRLYAINDAYVKAVSDLSYGVEVVEAVTHDGTSHKDLLAHTTVYSVLGASLTAADAHDGKYDFHLGVDFGRSGNYIDFSLYGGSDPSNGQTIYVKNRYNRTATRGTRTLVEVIDVPITKGAEDGTDSLTYTGADTIKRVLTGATVSGLTGAVVDAVEILRVNDTTGQSSSEYDSYTMDKNSTAAAHATSQIDWSAAGAQGVTPGGQPSTAATYYVSFRAWWHEVEGDMVVANSYDMYEEIEDLPTGLTAGLLRDWIDFRTSGVLPVSGDNPNFDYDYYLSRADRFIMDWTGIVVRIQGDAAYDPPIPQEQDSSYSIAVVRLSPYTYSLDTDVLVIPTGRLRISQAGLYDLAQRVATLEYDAASDRLTQTSVNDAAAVEAKGLFADPISDHSRCDVSFNKNGVKFDAAIDTNEQCIRLPIETTDVRYLEIDDANSYGIRRVGNTVTLDFEETVLQEQLKASKAISLNPDNIANFNNAVLSLDPENDVFMDQSQLPAVTMNLNNGLQALVNVENPELANQITWGSWHLANGTSIPNRPNEIVEGQTPDWSQVAVARDGSSPSLMVGRQTLDLGNRVVDISAVPFMRQITVTCTAKALYPGIDYACTIEGQAVDFTAVSPSVQGSASYSGHTTITSNSSGTLTGTIAIPTGIPMGTAHIRVFSAVNTEVSSAAALFYSQGWRETQQATTIGYESVTSRTNTITQQGALQYVDPVAQTFLLNTGPEYISAVGIWFKKKSATLPVTLEIRGTMNGFPNRVVSLSVTLLPSEVSVSDDASVETKFNFTNVVGFQPEEYAIVCLSNDDAYEAWCATVGEVDVVTGETITSQPAGGVLFHSPNASTWDPMTNSDLKYRIYKSNFQNNLQLVFTEMTGVEAAQFIIMASEVLAAPCNVSWSYSLDSGGSWVPIRAGIDVYLSSITDKIQLLLDVTNLGGSYQIVEKWAGILLQLCAAAGNYISYNQTFTDALDLPTSVTLYADLAVDGVNGAGVRTATPYFSVDDGEMWVELVPPAGYVPVAVGDGSYKEYKFTTPTQQAVTGASHATPIVLTSEDHGFKNNAIVVVASVGGNTAADGTWRVTAATTDTVTLVDPVTGANSVGNGDWTSGGTITMASFGQCRTRGLFATTNKARTPKMRRWRGNCA